MREVVMVNYVNRKVTDELANLIDNVVMEAHW